MAHRDVGVQCYCWVSKLLGYDFEIKFKPGVNNKAAANAFSRHFSLMNMHLHFITSHYHFNWLELQQKVRASNFLQYIIEEVSHKSQHGASHLGYIIDKWLLLYKGHVFFTSKFFSNSPIAT